MGFLTKEEMEIAYAQKGVTGYVVGELITFFQNNKVACPVLHLQKEERI